MVDSTSMVGQGMGLVMDQIYRALLGDAFANAKTGQQVTGQDLANSAFTVGLNALPFGAGGAVGRSLPALDQLAARAVINRTLRNPQFAIAMPEKAAAEVGKSRRVKNKFEMQEEDMPMEFRRGLEEELLGVPFEAPAQARPTYAALANDLPLPASVVQAFPGVTGEALRRTSRFNPSIEMYGGQSPVIASGSAKNLQGTFTIGDTFGRPSNVYQLNDRTARQSAVREAMDQLNRGGLQYIEAQIAAATNPGGAIQKISPIISNYSMVNNTATPAAAREALLRLRNQLSSGAPKVTTPKRIVNPKYEIDRMRRAYDPGPEA